ncbi:hypothetical protein L7F22_004793 [Adiantum nelumboides]|nr:hypothetical protein [Adiantum nelumboides]
MERDMGISESAPMEHCHALQASYPSSIAKAEQNTSYSNMLLLTGAEDEQSPMTQEPVKWSCADQVEQQACDQALAREDQQHAAFREPGNHENELEGPTAMDQASAALYLADDYTADNESFVADVTGNSQYISSFADSVLGNLSGQDDDNASADQLRANKHLNTEIVINVNTSESNVHDMVVSLSANVDLGDNKGVSISAYVNDHDNTAQDLVGKDGHQQLVMNANVMAYSRGFGEVNAVLVDNTEDGHCVENPHDTNFEVVDENDSSNKQDYGHAKNDSDDSGLSVIAELSSAFRANYNDASNVSVAKPHDICDVDMNDH